MINHVVLFGADHWEEWFNERLRATLVPLVVTHSSKVNRRAAVFLFDSVHREPRVVVKVAFTDRDAASSEAEHRALQAVHPLVGGLSPTIPRPLGFERLDSRITLFAQEALSGTRPLMPRLTGTSSLIASKLLRRNLQRTLAWSRQLASSTAQNGTSGPEPLIEIAERFAQTFPQSKSTLRALGLFRDELRGAHLDFQPCWQHGDVSLGNLLVHRGQVRVTDWEHASGRSEPWRDAAQAPAAQFVLAHSESHGLNFAELAARTLGETSWPGKALKATLEAHWDYPIPLPWAVLISTMRTALQARTFASTGGEVESQLARLLLSPGPSRQALRWLAPET